MTGPGITDEMGVYGSLLHYAMIIAFVGGAFLIFIYLWRKGRLDMDEAPKYEMMEDDEKVKENKNDKSSKRRK